MHSNHLSHTDQRGADPVETMKTRYLVILFIALLLSACTKGGSNNGTGGISFSLQMPLKEASQLQYKATNIPCIEYGITRVDAQVHDSKDNPVATGGPWPCDTGEGTIGNIEEGDGYTISISLKDDQGNVILRGSKGGIQVIAGQTTDAGLIELTNPNNPPVFGSIANQQVSELQLLTFIVSATDPDGNKLTYSATNLPTGATLDPTTGSFYWTPAYDQGGNYTVSFQATDDGSPSRSSTLDVNITVGNVNRPPVLTAQTSINFDTLLTSQLSFQVSATDPDSGDTLTFYAADLPQNTDGGYLSGVNFNPVTQTLTWTAAAGDPIGEYKVLFIVTDNGTPKMSDYAWVSIQRYQTTLNAATNFGPHYPVLSPIGTKQVALGGSVNFTVTATDSDGNPINYLSTIIDGKQPPTGYIFDSTSTQSFSWSSTTTPGNYWLRFTATDSLDYLSDSEDVIFTVGDVNRPPNLTPIGRRVVRNNQTITFTVTGTDPENNTLTYSAVASPNYSWPTGASFDPSTQAFTWTPSLASTPATSRIRFRVTDNGSPSESDYEDVAITVLP
jgi:hypothetical protein